jgi:hypothetical protein
VRDTGSPLDWRTRSGSSVTPTLRTPMRGADTGR